jgi:uncharacterized protein YcbK (DUF882 family)
MTNNLEFNQGRRNILRATAASMMVVAGSGLLVPKMAIAATPSPAIDLWPRHNDIRQIWIKRKSTGEEGIIRYYDGSSMQMPAYTRVCTILRDVQINEIANIDVELLDLMFVMQKWLVSWGIDRPLIINSGYRSVYTNTRTEGAAKNSMHMKGRAADITMQGIPVDYLGRLAAIFQKGGVGFYASNGFVHIDTGTVRYWRSEINRNKIS